MSLAEEVQISAVGTTPTNEPDIGIRLHKHSLLVCAANDAALRRVRVFYADNGANWSESTTDCRFLHMTLFRPIHL